MSDVINKYVSFWIQFQLSCLKHKLAVSKGQSFPFHSKQEDDHILITLKEPIHLIEWPQNATSKKKVHILIEGIEKIAMPSKQIIHSTVKVNYFEVIGPPVKMQMTPLESIHYDYEEPPRTAHPLFHAQLSNDLIDGVQKRAESLRNYNFDKSALTGRLRGIRIPTAHMSIVSVLVGLIADHYPKLLPEILIAINKASLPKAHCRNLYDKVNKDSCSFASMLWYRS